MVVVHICTDESLARGLEEPPRKCGLCGCQTLRSTYVDCYCTTCGYRSDTNWVTGVRQKLGLSRKELAQKLGVTAATLKNYEFCSPSQRVIRDLAALTRRHYGPEADNCLG